MKFHTALSIFGYTWLIRFLWIDPIIIPYKRGLDVRCAWIDKYFTSKFWMLRFSECFVGVTKASWSPSQRFRRQDLRNLKQSHTHTHPTTEKWRRIYICLLPPPSIVPFTRCASLLQSSALQKFPSQKFSRLHPVEPNSAWRSSLSLSFFLYRESPPLSLSATRTLYIYLSLYIM